MKQNEKKSTQVIKSQTSNLSTFQSADMLINQLAGKDVNIEKLEKLLEIKGKYEAKENAKLFHEKFSELQFELPVIKKTKQVFTKGGDLMYAYAPLEKIIEQIKPILKKYNFSYKWSEGLSEREGYKRIWCHIMAYGHEEKSFIDIPIQAGNNFINAAQQAGSSSTYGKRYSLIGSLGIMADEDDDGQSLKNLKPEDNEEKLKLVFAIYEVAKKYGIRISKDGIDELKNYKHLSMSVLQTKLEKINAIASKKVMEESKIKNKPILAKDPSKKEKKKEEKKADDIEFPDIDADIDEAIDNGFKEDDKTEPSNEAN